MKIIQRFKGAKTSENERRLKRNQKQSDRTQIYFDLRLFDAVTQFVLLSLLKKKYIVLIAVMLVN